MATRVPGTEHPVLPEEPVRPGLDSRPVDADDAALEAIAARRWRVALALTGAMLVVYFGFILLIAFEQTLMGQLLTRGLSIGILLGALVIVAAWLLTLGYVGWANRIYDPELARIRGEEPR